MNISALQAELQRFAADRDWEQFHSVRNLVLALVGEVGELAEALQWVSDDQVAGFLDNGGRQHMGEELADILIYLVRLADKSGIDLDDAVTRKLAANATKYPPDQARGNAKKYTEFTS